MLPIAAFTIKLSANKAAGVGLGESEDVGGVITTGHSEYPGKSWVHASSPVYGEGVEERMGRQCKMSV